jgi:hypothetical protein
MEIAYEQGKLDKEMKTEPVLLSFISLFTAKQCELYGTDRRHGHDSHP